MVKVKEDKTKASCSVCHKTIELSTSGRSALTDNIKGKKHTEVIDRRKNFLKPKPSISTSADTSKWSKSAATTDLKFKKDDQCTLDNILSQTNSSGVSVRFNDDIRETFSAMFPDINFKDFFLNRIKVMYVINHGVGPCSQTLLIDALGQSEIHVYSFDESLNDSTQTSEMNLYVRY